MIVCPYHAWSYRLDGALHRAPQAEGRPGFDASEICLTSIPTEAFHGFVFVNLDPAAPPMDEVYPGMREELGVKSLGFDLDVVRGWLDVPGLESAKIQVEDGNRDLPSTFIASARRSER